MLGRQSGPFVYCSGSDRGASKLFAVRSTPRPIRSDNGPEFVAKAVRRWLDWANVETLFVAKGSPWE